MSIIEKTLSNSAYWQVNKAIARYLGENDAALLLSDLISKKQYFRDRGELRSDGSFFNIAEHLEKDLNLTHKRRIKMTKLLVAKGLISVKKEGLPSKNYYLILEANIEAVLKSEPQLGTKVPVQSGTNRPHWSGTKGSANNNKHNNNKGNKNKSNNLMVVVEQPCKPSKSKKSYNYTQVNESVSIDEIEALYNQLHLVPCERIRTELEWIYGIVKALPGDKAIMGVFKTQFEVNTVMGGKMHEISPAKRKWLLGEEERVKADTSDIEETNDDAPYSDYDDEEDQDEGEHEISSPRASNALSGSVISLSMLDSITLDDDNGRLETKNG